jgi:hypothetical protein
MDQQQQQQWEQILNQPTIPHVIKPKVWGPHLWSFLHCLALAYPQHPSMEDQANMHRYFHAMKNVLPCHMCKVDFTRMIEDDPIEYHLDSREKLCRWIVDKHNQVNAKIGAPAMSFEDSVLIWGKGRAAPLEPLQRGTSAPLEPQYRGIRPQPILIGAEVGVMEKQGSRVLFFLVLILLFLGGFYWKVRPLLNNLKGR